MENKKLVTSGKMTRELIGGWFLWGILFGILYEIIYAIISTVIDSRGLLVILTVLLQGITVFLVWKCATQSSFKKKTISSNDVSTVMRNLIIFTIIISLISGILNFVELNSEINDLIEYNNKLQSISTTIYNKTPNNSYYAYNDTTLDEEIQKQITNVYIYLAVLEIGLTFVYLAVLPLEKREILKYID